MIANSCLRNFISAGSKNMFKIHLYVLYIVASGAMCFVLLSFVVLVCRYNLSNFYFFQDVQFSVHIIFVHL
jgi:hypothetical protein